MKRLKTLQLLIASLAVLFLLISNAHAMPVDAGGNKFLMDGYSYIKQTQDKLWGVFSVEAIKEWDPATESVGSSYWQSGDNDEYLNIKFGGLDVDISSTDNPQGFGYFVNGWAELYLNEGTDPFQDDVDAKPGSDYNKTDFGTNMTSGTKLLDLEFAPGGILAEENAGSSYYATSDHTFRVNALSVDSPTTRGYLNVIGGEQGHLFDSDLFFDQFDIRIEGSNQLRENAEADDWNYAASSYSAYTQVVPEPTTWLLFGTGLLGLAAFGRRKMKKSIK